MYLKKGNLVYLQGRLCTRDWQNEQIAMAEKGMPLRHPLCNEEAVRLEGRSFVESKAVILTEQV